MIIYLQCRSSVPIKRFRELLEKHNYVIYRDLDSFDFLGLVIDTEKRRAIAGNPKPEHRVLYLQEVFELELLPSVETINIMLESMFGHPSDA